MTLLNPLNHPNWVQPHSLEWYQNLGKSQAEYRYPWNSTVKEPNGETIFDLEVFTIIKNKNVLDVGCGHGAFTKLCSNEAARITGFDVTEEFIKTAQHNHIPNLSFVVGHSKSPLPFKADEFDCAYIRKGPSSGYPLLKSVVKKGGEVLGLHPGDETGKELSQYFPNLFEISKGKPVLDKIATRIKSSNFTYAVIEVINSLEYLHTPLDVIKLRCFGQNLSIYQSIKEEYLSEITSIFESNASPEGLPITHSMYIVRAVV